MPTNAPWSPPRGRRVTPGGPWQWALFGRPEDSYRDRVEQQAVMTYRGLVKELLDARDDLGMSLRGLAARTGVALSTLTAMEQGSSWPRLSTMAVAAEALDRRLCLDGVEDISGAVMAKAQAGWARLDGFAHKAGVRPQTVYTLRRDGRQLSMETLLRLSLTARLAWSLETAPNRTKGPIADR